MSEGLKAWLIVLDADDGRVVRLFNLERKAVGFVASEHRRRWDQDADDRFRDGQGLEVASLYFLTLKESRLVDEYSVLADENGDAEGWKSAERNEIAKISGLYPVAISPTKRRREQ